MDVTNETTNSSKIPDGGILDELVVSLVTSIVVPSKGYNQIIFQKLLFQENML